MNPSISIELLGHLAVQHGDEQTTRFRTQKTATLLAYLAFYSHRPHPREELIDLLWPEVDVESGRTSLRTALASLRRQLESEAEAEGGIVLADRLTVRLNPDRIRTDVAEFEAALQSAHQNTEAACKIEALQRAVALYRGPLLPGWYDDWVLRERNRLEQLFVSALRALADALESQGRSAEALPHALRWIEADPLTEEAHLAVMRLLAATGQMPAAKRRFREWQRIAQEQLGETPSPGATALLERLGDLANTPSAASPRPVAAPVSPPPPTSVPLSPLPTPTATPFPSPPSPVAAPVPSVTPASSLPLQLTRFFGRESEIRQVCEWLRSGQTRLLTLTGPGGTGKTRLALEVACRLAEEWEQAVWFVPLADLTEAARVPDMLAKTLSVRLSPDTDPLQQITDTLPAHPLLLILDNFEQLPEEAVGIVHELLTRVPSLRCLVTSRVPLFLHGEQVLPLAPLPSPTETDTGTSPDHLLRFASVRMFEDRARLVRPDFQVTEANAGLVAGLCRKLEGIPLAVELTAAWTQTLTPGQILERLNRRFDLLTSRRKDLPVRHRTLRATLEWSYRLLSPELQTLFARLSVFHGGWTLEAAEAICGPQEEDPETHPLSASAALSSASSPLEQLSLLCEHSLVLTEEHPEGMRYRQLETLREYGLEQMTPEARRLQAVRHRDYFLAFAEEVERQLEGPEQVTWLNCLEQEHDNLRAALRFSQQEEDWEAALRLAGALSEFWHRRGYGREGLYWLETLVQEGKNIPPAVLAKALDALATTQYLFGKFDRVIELYQQSIALYEQIGDLAAMAKGLQRMHTPVIFHFRDVQRARSLLEQSLTLGRRSGDLKRVADTLISLGSLAREQGETVLADSMYGQSIALNRQIGNRNGMAQALFEIGYMATQQKDFARADTVLQEALTISRELNNRLFIGHILWLLGRLREIQGELTAARRYLEEAMQTARQSGDQQQTFNIITNLGIVAEQEHDYATAYRYFAESLTVARAMGHRWTTEYALGNMASMTLKLHRYAETQTLCHQSLSILQDGGNPSSISASLLKLAQAAAHTEQPYLATRLFGAVEASREKWNHPVTSQQHADLSADLEFCRTALGETAYTRLWEEGRSLSQEESIMLALLAEPSSV